MLLLVVVAVTIAIFWRAAREKPQYCKTYYDTRSSGVFRTEYAPGFEDAGSGQIFAAARAA